MTYTKQEFEFKVNVILDVRKNLAYSGLLPQECDRLSNEIADFAIQRLREAQKVSKMVDEAFSNSRD